MSIKRLLLHALFAMVVFRSVAQNAPGTMVGNFTLTDVQGNTHTLFDYLDQGRMVVIEISATWCGPCWNYHETGALNAFYNEHGPGSTANDAMVFFIEGDVNTTLADLYGTGTNTHGDWVAGENMPVIDLTSDTYADFSNSGLQIPFFPVMYVICPNRVIQRSGVAGVIGSQAALNFYSGLCPAPATFPTDPAFLKYTGDTTSCTSFDLKVVMQNNGTETLTSADIFVTGIPTPFVYNWTGNLQTYDTTTVKIGRLNLTTSDSVLLTISSPDSNAGNSTIVRPLHFIGETPPLAINTVADFSNPSFPYTDWQLINPDGRKTWEYRSIMSGMLKMDNYNYYSADGHQLDEFITQAFDVSGEANPYLLFKVAYRRINESYIDILKVSVSESCTGPFTEVYTNQDTSLATGPDLVTPFTPSVPSDFRQECVDLSPWAHSSTLYVKFTNVLGFGNNLYIDDISVSNAPCTTGSGALEHPSNIQIFPNPATNRVFINADDNLVGATYAVYDPTGRMILNGKIISEHTAVELEHLPGGVYLLCIGDSLKQTFSVIKK
jgi:hypothetical protein